MWWEKSPINFSKGFLSQRTRKNGLKHFPGPGTPSEVDIKFLKTSKMSTFNQKDHTKSLYPAVAFCVGAENSDSIIVCCSWSLYCTVWYFWRKLLICLSILSVVGEGEGESSRSWLVEDDRDSGCFELLPSRPVPPVKPRDGEGRDSVFLSK